MIYGIFDLPSGFSPLYISLITLMSLPGLGFFFEVLPIVLKEIGKEL